MKPFFAIGIMFSIGLLTGCVPLAPEAQAVKVTRNPEDVAGCKILGTVKSEPPYVAPKDGMHQMQNNTAGLGGNVLFVTSYNVTGTAMAYQCSTPTVTQETK